MGRKTQNDLGEFMFGAPTYSFHVDPTVDTKELQLNVDLTVAMPCHCKPISPPSFPFPRSRLRSRLKLSLRIEVEIEGIANMTVLSIVDLSIDVRDVVGDRLHLSDDFVKDGTVWETGRALNVQ
jgi:hypothetical protein